RARTHPSCTVAGIRLPIAHGSLGARGQRRRSPARLRLTLHDAARRDRRRAERGDTRPSRPTDARPMKTLIEKFRWQQAGFVNSFNAQSPFYASLCDECIADVEHDGAIAQVLAPFATAPIEDVHVLRLFAGFHLLALTSQSSELAAHFPSTGGDGDVH